MCVSRVRERRERAGGAHGERQAKESPETANHLLELPAGCTPTPLPEDTVLGTTGARRARSLTGPHADSGQKSCTFSFLVRGTLHSQGCDLSCSALLFLSRRWRSGFRTGAPSSKSCGKMGRFRRSNTWAQVTLLRRLLPRTPPGISPRINKLQETGTLTQNRPQVPLTPLRHHICPTILGTHPRARIYSQARSRNPITTPPWALVPFSSHKLGDRLHLLQDNELVVHIQARGKEKHTNSDMQFEFWWFLFFFCCGFPWRTRVRWTCNKPTHIKLFFYLFICFLFAVTGQWDKSHAKYTKKKKRVAFYCVHCKFSYQTILGPQSNLSCCLYNLYSQ